MSNKKNELVLLDAMVLLEVADQMYPSVNRFFSQYSTSNLISAAHDLVQHAYSQGEAPIENSTKELLATLESARKYMDCGGHLYKSNNENPEEPSKVQQGSSIFQRILARLGI